MTEREYYREREERRDDGRGVYQQREVARDDYADPAYAPSAQASREVSREQVVDYGDERVVRRERVHVPSESARRDMTARRFQQAIAFIVGVLVTLIAIRFVLLLLAASAASPFVQLIYGLTQLPVAPFFGIFPEPTLDGSVVEWASLVAIVIYSLIGYGLNRLVDVTYKPARTPSY
jgi:hypothetical protein